MTEFAKIQYTLNDYNAILFGTYKNETTNPMEYSLPQNVLNIINTLSKKFGVSDIIDKPKRQRYIPKVQLTDESWVNTNIFKPTVVIHKPEGTEKVMNDIRVALNKMSNKNYETNRNIIIELLTLMVEENDLIKIGNNIFDIASTNKFFSEIYAKLYKDISEKFPQIFNNILLSFLEGFTNTMKTICYVDQKDNYDNYCKYNKDNDKRKSTSMFITNLLKNNVIQSNVLTNIIENIQCILFEYMNQENRINEVEEVIENMYILLTNNVVFLKSCSNTKIITTVQEISKLKAKELPSISSRSIFKCMDILDKYENVNK